MHNFPFYLKLKYYKVLYNNIHTLLEEKLPYLHSVRCSRSQLFVFKYLKVDLCFSFKWISIGFLLLSSLVIFFVITDFVASEEKKVPKITLDEDPFALISH